jgi:hypothetical protein
LSPLFVCVCVFFFCACFPVCFLFPKLGTIIPYYVQLT